MINDIAFIFEYRNRLVQLPVNPPKIQVTFDSNNKVEEVIQLGEINILRNRKLATIKFDTFFPEDDWFPAIRTKNKFEKPKFYKDFFEGLMNQAKECRFIVTGIDLNMLVSIEGFDYSHQAGDHEDAYYTLELKEYRPFGISYETKSVASTGEKILTVAPKRTETKIAIGSSVILNGTVHADSYGSRPGKTFSNYSGKINLINPKGTHPYHVTTPDGGWLGWVKESAVVLS